MVMTWHYSYLLYQVERPKTAADLRAEDARAGELAAALAGTATAVRRLASRAWQRPAKECGRPAIRPAGSLS
jgi:hypothetical protein